MGTPSAELAQVESVCDECSHMASSHGRYGEGCDECSCLLSAREVVEGRDADLDETIRQALWEDAVIDGWDPEANR